MSAVSKALYLPLSIGSSVAGGLLAGRIFTEIWQRISPSDREPPDPKDLDRSGREAITAAALQGLVFGLVRAAVDRASAKGYKAVTNESPSIAFCRFLREGCESGDHDPDAEFDKHCRDHGVGAHLAHPQCPGALRRLFPSGLR